ncbi:DUF6704 family protein [Aquipuribacter sp. SD81]|uniref:DUF6704 family protein n=1 Tax=Aquipuribacter sp. SD81 TaxID=3127703 RepID=UPI00301A2D46
MAKGSASRTGKGAGATRASAGGTSRAAAGDARQVDDGRTGAGRPDAGQTDAGHAGAGHADDGHGTSVAAWTATGGIMLGGLLVAIFMIFWSLVGIVVGAVVMVLSALAGPVLARAGYGASGSEREYTGGPRAVR